MHLHLDVFHGPDGTVVFRVPLAVGQALVFGRWPVPKTDVCLPSIHINRRHFEVGRDELGAWVRDLNSINGTWVNDCQVGAWQAVHRLRLDDVIRVCDARVRLGATMPVDPSWLDWNNGTVRKIAQAIYAEHTLGHLPILADALEEAGCTDPEILGHCRDVEVLAHCHGPGPHSRGCWVVDLLLGKE